MIAAKKAAREALGPVLVLDDGDYSKGTARRGDARDRVGANFGNHEFDFGPDGLGTSIAVAAKAGRTPPIVAIDLSKDDPTLVDLQRLSQEGMLRRYLVIKRGGLRFGLFGLVGKDAAIYISGSAGRIPPCGATKK